MLSFVSLDCRNLYSKVDFSCDCRGKKEPRSINEKSRKCIPGQLVVKLIVVSSLVSHFIAGYVSGQDLNGLIVVT